MKKTNKRYSEEFKKEVIEYAMSSNQKISDICRHFNIGSGNYYHWKKQILGDEVNQGARGDAGSAVSKEALMDENRALRKQLARKDRDLEILKKATLIFGNDPQ